ncbi:DUF3231 family protein [Priestia flexa]|uniref:DUF3231 family protein n=1 Tax=Priestia flexa TaxID=86664 RepID=UPI0026B7B772|nr:DUF3231 family protein [Priestia flexa]
MIHAIEALTTYLKTINTNKHEPLHIGEAMGCWLYFTALTEEIPAIETSLHTTTDETLLELAHESKLLALTQRNKLKEFMLHEGIPLSDIPAQKPESDPYQIPPGVRATDSEIANLISAKVASNIIMCSTNISQSIRNDVGMLWLKFHSEKVAFGFKVKETQREKGWLKKPPSYTPPGS